MLPVAQDQPKPPKPDHTLLDCLNGSWFLGDINKTHLERKENDADAAAERKMRATSGSRRRRMKLQLWRLSRRRMSAS